MTRDNDRQDGIFSDVRALVLAVAMCVSAVASGCSAGTGTDGSAESTRVVRTSSDVQVRDGKLTADPPPLTFAQIQKVGPKTPAGTVLFLYFWAQWGSIPNVVEMYDPRMRDALGVMTITDAYVDQRPSLLGTGVIIRNTVRTRLGTVVTVDGLSKSYPASHESFLLRRAGGRWYVVQDTVLERAVALLVGTRASRGFSGQAAIRRSARAGAVAARSYRRLALRVLGFTPGEARRRAGAGR
jgi:hypothetical protein